MLEFVTLGLQQSLVASVFALAATVLVRKWNQPFLVYCIWLIVLAKFVVPPIASVVVPFASRTEVVSAPLPATGRVARHATSSHTESLEVRWPTVLGVIWISGTCFVLITAAKRMLQFHRYARRADAASSEASQECREIAKAMGVSTAPSVRISNGVPTPLVWAFSRPAIILLPRDLLPKLTKDERTTVIGHELGHLKRHDHLLRVFELIVVSMNWWNPFVWYARRRLHLACESCCDIAVVRTFPALLDEYGHALLKVTDFISEARSSTLPIGTSGIEKTHSLVRRIEVITDHRNTQRSSWWLRFVVGLLALAVLPFSVQVLRAEEKPKDEVKYTIMRPGGKKESVTLRRRKDGKYVDAEGTVRNVPRGMSSRPIEEQVASHKKRTVDFDTRGRKQISERVKKLKEEGKLDEARHLQKSFFIEMNQRKQKGLMLQLELLLSQREKEKKEMAAMRETLGRLQAEIKRLSELGPR